MKLNPKKIIIRISQGIVVLILLIIVGFMGWREYMQYSVASEREITTANGIDILEAVQIGGIDQWINVRGQDKDNPIILFIHGGPGGSMIPFSHIYQTPWEEHFTVVNWDQRGSGKTYTGNDEAAVLPTMSIDRMVEDAREVSEHLIKRFDKEKIIVLGHSWGSILGTLLVKRHPELFHAYIGMGQLINTYESEVVSYNQTLKVARERNIPEAIEEIEALAPYPDPTGYNDNSLLTLRKWQIEFGFNIHGLTTDELMKIMILGGLSSPEYTLLEMKDVLTDDAGSSSMSVLGKEFVAFDLYPLGYDFEVPVFFLLGRHDWLTASVVAEEYFSKVTAPYKHLVWFEQSAHNPFFEEPDKFLEALVESVLPHVEKK